MIKVISLVVAAVALTSCGAFSPPCAAPDAKSIVKAVDARRVFRQSLADVSRATLTSQIVAARDPTGYEKSLAVAVEHAVSRHGAAWETDMVSAYTDTLNAAELQASCTALNAGDKDTFMRLAARPWAELQRKEQPVLRRAGADVLKELFEGSIPK